jgi:hypothetical protein
VKKAEKDMKPRITTEPAGRQTLWPREKQSVVAPSKKKEKASPETWKKIRRRAGELAGNEGKRPQDANEEHLRHAKRELLGLQTLSDPENPDSGAR